MRSGQISLMDGLENSDDEECEYLEQDASKEADEDETNEGMDVKDELVDKDASDGEEACETILEKRTTNGT